ncbi:unnamed protein product [Mycena citricolor]|uniref:Protein kinase domain-containing protein n=1 Tax=Mycena citricolor TaxID=2018698 RepID=A0AAD2HTJ0_9AGAR|nr:unnamed protein product [Mycena citricolor]
MTLSRSSRFGPGRPWFGRDLIVSHKTAIYLYNKRPSQPRAIRLPWRAMDYRCVSCLALHGSRCNNWGTKLSIVCHATRACDWSLLTGPTSLPTLFLPDAMLSMHTPPRTTYDSPMLTPSPLRRHPTDAMFQQSPFKPRPLTPENSDATVFLASPTKPLLTPAKKISSRTPLSLNTNTATAAGTKRKSSQHTISTPLRLTPLPPTSGSGISFQRLAPLPAPQFATRTPQSIAEADAHIRSHTATLTQLRISDLQDEFEDDELPVLSRPEEIVEACSPGGHITKRRARSRPVSQELMMRGSPSPVAFPSARGRSPSCPSSPETGSPVPRKRVTNMRPPRAPLERIESAATLFFGPPIHPPPVPRARLSSARAAAPDNSLARPGRHSYAGPSCSTQPWEAVQARPRTPSPHSSPPCIPTDIEDDDQDMFFNAPHPETSFTFSVTANTPSPRNKKPVTIPKKCNMRDSGVALSDEEMEQMMPRASTSVNSINSDEMLVTPGLEPELGSGWPTIFGNENALDGGVDVEGFFRRIATAKSKNSTQTKKAPGTPVKRVKTSYIGAERPWQSAVAHKVGLPGFSLEPKPGKAPRKSLPAVFPALGRKQGKAAVDLNSDSDGEEESPSSRRDKYVGVGLGRPLARTRWLTRRSSSGAFSSGSDSASIAGTPTRAKGRDWHLPKPHLFSPSTNALSLSPGRSVSSSSSSTLGSPTGARQQSRKKRTTLTPLPGRRLSDQSFERVGYFEREFEELDELGSGEFGKVIKVRSRTRCAEYAVKKSKRFEGVRHRLRLREEVEILQHLTCSGVQPNVLTLVDSWEEDDMLYIQTDLCELGNFAHFLWEFGRLYPRLDEGRIWKILVELGNGLEFIHNRNVIHLDLKPSNILVTGNGHFKIGDFGMASVWPRMLPAADSESVGLEREGDKMYLAPEVLQGRYGKAADVFSFGMTMLETASNIVVPDQGDSWLRLRREDFSQIDMDDMPELFTLIREMMLTDPALRIDVGNICRDPIVQRASARMASSGESPLASCGREFVLDILGRMEEERM